MVEEEERATAPAGAGRTAAGGWTGPPRRSRAPSSRALRKWEEEEEGGHCCCGGGQRHRDRAAFIGGPPLAISLWLWPSPLSFFRFSAAGAGRGGPAGARLAFAFWRSIDRLGPWRSRVLGIGGKPGRGGGEARRVREKGGGDGFLNVQGWCGGIWQRPLCFGLLLCSRVGCDWQWQWQW